VAGGGAGLTAGPLVLHPQVLLALAGVLVELALAAVVVAVAAAHRLLAPAVAAEGAHALRREAVRRLDAGAAVAAGDVGAGVLQSCGGAETRRHGSVRRAARPTHLAHRCFLVWLFTVSGSRLNLIWKP